jgi:hypothetical protein
MNSLANLVDLHKCYEVLSEESVIFSHKGALDGEMIDVIIQLADKKLVKAKTRVRIKKKIINILIECLQNSFHYTSTYEQDQVISPTNKEENIIKDSEEEEENNDPDQWKDLIESPYVILSQKKESYFILTGNYITHDKADVLKKRIDEITAFNDEELQKYYIQSLDKDELPKQGGAGLGLIDIIRRSKHNVSFNFKEVDEKYQRFNLLIKVE